MEAMNLRTGDLVIGTRDPSKSVYSAEGRKLVDGGVAIVGDEEDIQELQQQIKKAAKQSGQQIVEEKKPRKKAIKKSNKVTKYIPVAEESPNYLSDMSETVVENSYTVEEKIKPQQVYFENAFGKIRSAVERVIEHDLAFMLLFSSEDEIVFEPKISETLDFTYNKASYSVYYPGVIFDWTDGVKKAMILFKVPEENE